ncbi:MAG: hypothetical protein GC191_09780 [Azospirillum sp.]|nr:hypothetical protein [Azospirillum sp.]
MTNLLRQTVEGRLSWKKSSEHLHLTSKGDLTSAIYVAKCEGVRFRLYRVQEKNLVHYYGEQEPDLFWTTRHVLEIPDDEGFSLEEFESSDALEDLFDAVRSRVGGLNEKMSKLMEKEPTHAQ